MPTSGEPRRARGRDEAHACTSLFVLLLLLWLIILWRRVSCFCLPFHTPLSFSAPTRPVGTSISNWQMRKQEKDIFADLSKVTGLENDRIWTPVFLPFSSSSVLCCLLLSYKLPNSPFLFPRMWTWGGCPVTVLRLQGKVFIGKTCHFEPLLLPAALFKFRGCHSCESFVFSTGLPPKCMTVIGYLWNPASTSPKSGIYSCCQAAPRVPWLPWKIWDVLR